MCGIFGYVGKKQAQPLIFEALKKLEYRGYDSSGIAVRGRGLTIVKDKIRNWKPGFKDAVFETCCGLHNFRLNFRPWHYQPIQFHLFVPF